MSESYHIQLAMDAEYKEGTKLLYHIQISNWLKIKISINIPLIGKLNNF